MFDIDYDMEWERDSLRDEFRKPRPFRCCDGYCGDPSCHRCFPGNTYYQSYENEDDEIIDLLN